MIFGYNKYLLTRGIQGFYRGGVNPKEGATPIIREKILEICMKMYKVRASQWRRGGGGGGGWGAVAGVLGRFVQNLSM